MITENSFTEIVESVKDQIEYDHLIKSERIDADFMDCVVILIAEVYTSKEPEAFIARETHSAKAVKDRFLLLTSEHIKYVYDCLNGTKTKVKNIRQYLRAALFNAPVTMGAYFQRKVREDTGL